MKKLKGILTIIIILSTLFFGVTVQAASSTMKLSVAESNIKVGDTINVYLSLQEFQDVEGLTAVGGVLSYDANVLEYKSISSENGWSSVNYNADNGKFITTQDVLTGRGNIFKITFKVLAKPANNTTTVSITGFDVTDDEVEVTTADASLTITITESTTSNPDNDSKNNEIIVDTNETDNNNHIINTNRVDNDKKPEEDKTIAGSKMPQTGTTEWITAGLVMAIAIVGVIAYVKYRKTKID